MKADAAINLLPQDFFFLLALLGVPCATREDKPECLTLMLPELIRQFLICWQVGTVAIL